MRVVLASIILLLSFRLPAEAADNAGKKTLIISGRVLDYRFKGKKDVGIPGVSVEAINSNEAVVSQTLTDAAGAFTLLGIDAKLVTLKFQKIGYRKNPTLINWPAALDSVYLMRANAEASYFQDIGNNIKRSGMMQAKINTVLDRMINKVGRKTVGMIGVDDDDDESSSQAQKPKKKNKTHETYSIPHAEMDFEEYAFFRSLGPTLAERKVVIGSLAGKDANSLKLWTELDVVITAEELQSLDSSSATRWAKENELLQDVEFASKSSEILLTEREALESSITLLSHASSFYLLVTGHADDEGDVARNNALANIRARAVRDYLARRGIQTNRLIIKSASGEKPSCSIIQIVCEPRNKKVVLALAREHEIANLPAGAGDGANFENKIVLSIAARLAAERYMATKINDGPWLETIEKNQGFALLKRFQTDFPTEMEALRILRSVALMTPENIHLNAFMYEPILDMSDDHLRTLYRDVLSLK